ncbi:hypothetical protein [Streptomyces mesophilus]|uniref:hypothetical protein n=1 Tax=Streptomyces mesophilus TaxID=1775132 RepID=UPI003330AD81
MSYEDEFGEALRRTGEEFSTDPRALVEAGHARGRRLVRRRRATVFGGAAAIAAIAVTSAVVLPGLGGQGMESAAPAGSTESAGTSKGAEGTAADGGEKVKEGKGGTKTSGGHVSAKELIATLTSLLPEGEVSAGYGHGTDDERANPNAGVTFDDGDGAAAIRIAFTRLGEDERQVAEDMTTCPDKALVAYDTCEVDKLSDGSRLMVFQGYDVHGSQKGGTKYWQAVLATPEGHVIDAGEYNSSTEKGAAVTRPQPPLTTAQLKALVTSDKWDPVFGAPEKRQPKNSGSDDPAKSDPGNVDPGKGDSGKGDAGKGDSEGNEAPASPEQQAIRSTLIGLLPQGVKVTGQGGDGSYAYVVVDDGKGASMVQINVQPNMDDVRGELFNGAEELPDGTVFSWRESGGDKGVDGAVMWTADTLRPDGLRVIVSAFNSGTQHDAPSRETPALSKEQLKSLAASAKWAEIAGQ